MIVCTFLGFFLAPLAPVVADFIVGHPGSCEAGFAQALSAPRWMGWLPVILLGMLACATFAGFRRGRRRGSTFVIMRGRVSCPECSYLLDLDDRHCARCGAAVVQTKKRLQCAKCRARNWEDDRFCRRCGCELSEGSI